MVTIRVVKPFIRRGEVIPVGTQLTVPSEALPKLHSHIEVIDLHRMVGEALAAVDREGRPWPVRFFASLPAEDRERLRTLERDIDQAVLNNDAMALPGLLNEWRALLISRLN